MKSATHHSTIPIEHDRRTDDQSYFGLYGFNLLQGQHHQRNHR